MRRARCVDGVVVSRFRCNCNLGAWSARSEERCVTEVVVVLPGETTHADASPRLAQADHGPRCRDAANRLDGGDDDKLSPLKRADEVLVPRHALSRHEAEMPTVSVIAVSSPNLSHRVYLAGGWCVGVDSRWPLRQKCNDGVHTPHCAARTYDVSSIGRSRTRPSVLHPMNWFRILSSSKLHKRGGRGSYRSARRGAREGSRDTRAAPRARDRQRTSPPRCTRPRSQPLPALRGRRGPDNGESHQSARSASRRAGRTNSTASY